MQLTPIRRSRPRAPALCALVAAACLPAPAAPAAREFAVAPPPAWATLADPPDAESSALDASDGVLDLLDDEQVRVTAAGAERFYRQATKVLSAAGLEEASQLEFEFDPTYERLVIHHVRVVRGGRTIDALEPSEIDVLRQEDELDERLYNGTLTAVAFLSDVRPGDVVDYAFSVNGSNPVFGGRYASDFNLDGYHPVRLLRRRLLWPDGRAVRLHYTGEETPPSVRPLAGETEYLWERADVAALDAEEGAPAWYSPVSYVLASEYATWADVVEWALPLYDASGPLSPEMAEQVEAWRAASAGEEERFLAALRFVQDEVRYLGIELGTSSHRPNPPAGVFSRRFGDCKDKSLLLATLLGALGIEAHPALVNTELGRRIDSWLPSPVAFDHVVVRATVGGKTRWVDPTLSHQRGALERLAGLDYERALVLREGSAGLEEIPLAPLERPTTVVRQLFTVASYDAPATLEVETTYSGWDADAVRAEFAAHPVSKIARRSLDAYADDYPEIEADGTMEVRDDERSGELVVVERYRIPGFWKERGRGVVPDAVLAEAAIPRGTRRVAPLSVPYPLSVAQTIEIRLPDRPSVEEESGTVSDGIVEFGYRLAGSEGAVTLDYRYRTLADHVPAAKLAEHVATLEKIHSLAGYAVSAEAARPGAAGAWLAGALAVALLLPLALGLARFGARRKRESRRIREFRRSLARSAGEVPEKALALGNGEAVESYLAGQRCNCGASLAARARDAVNYDGRRLTVVGLACPTCGSSRDVYFA